MNVTSKGLRDLFFLAVGTAILYKQFWEQTDPSPLGVFVALFLYGLIPAFRADEGSAPGPLTVLAALLAALGGRGTEVKAGPEGREAPEGRDPAAEPEVKAGLEGREADPSTSSPPESSEPGSR